MNGESSYRRFLVGDNTAIGELVEKYNKSLVFYLLGILKTVDRAEDAAAEAFVKLLVKKPRLRDDLAFRSYLFRIGRNCAIDMLRKESRNGDMVTDEIEDSADVFSLEEQLLKAERDRCLHTALKTLKSEYRDVLHLLYFEEMDYKTAAATMGKSVKQVTNLAYRAKGALKKILEEKGFDYEI